MLQKKILIVDDEPPLRALVSCTLEDERFQILEAVDGQDALTKTEQFHPDVIILDLMMPKMTGLEVCQAVKTSPTLHDVKIIMLTAKSQEQDFQETMKAGADFYMKKPFSPLELMTLVERTLEPTNTSR